MNRTEFMRQLESLLQNISATEREEALQYYNEYFNDAGPENEQNVIEALGNPAKVAENIKKDIFGNGYGENIYQKINADNRAVITYPADSGAKSGAGEAGFGQENEAQAAGAVSSRKKEGMSTGMIVLIVILCILASPVILGVASAGIGVAAGLIVAWLGSDRWFRGNGSSTDTDSDRTGGCRDHQSVYASLRGNGADRCRTDLRRCRTSVPDVDRGHGGNRHTGDLLLDRRIIPEKR